MNLGQIRTLARTLLSEPSAVYWSDVELNNYINYGIEDFCVRTDCLEDISTGSTVQYQADYDLPTDYTKIKQVEIVKGNSVYYLVPEDLIEQYTGIVKTTQNPSRYYNIWQGKLRLRERPSVAATSTTLNGNISSTSAASIALTSASGLPRMGRMIVDSEVIQYWGISSNTLTPCDRGVEGTTAATHTTGATITHRDIWVYHLKKDATLSSDTESPSIPTYFHSAFAYYCAALGRRKSKDHDLAGVYDSKYEQYVDQALDWSKLKWKRVYSPK